MNNEIEQEKIGAMQMWDTDKGSWVSFCVWGAHFIVNHRKEHLVLRKYSQIGPIKGWYSVDSSYMNNHLKENKDDDEKNTPYLSFAGYQDFYEMVRQDIQEYKNEGREIEVMRI